MSEVIELVGGPLDGLLIQVPGRAPNLLRLPIFRADIWESKPAPEQEVELSTVSYSRQEFRRLKGCWAFSYIANL